MAVKFSVSENNDNREINILREISAVRGDHPGQNHLVQMLDYFMVDGPNGTHGCLVLEFLGPSVQGVIDSYRDHRLPAALAKSTAYQALQGLKFLLQHKIVHAGKPNKLCFEYDLTALSKTFTQETSRLNCQILTS